MDAIKRLVYSEYISEGIIYVQKECGGFIPEDTILVVNYLHDLAQIDDITGLKIWACYIPSWFMFSLAFPSENESSYKMLAKFIEYQELYKIEFGDQK